MVNKKPLGLNHEMIRNGGFDKFILGQVPIGDSLGSDPFFQGDSIINLAITPNIIFPPPSGFDKTSSIIKLQRRISVPDFQMKLRRAALCCRVDEMIEQGSPDTLMLTVPVYGE